MQIPSHKTGYHAVACAHAVDHLALGAADAVGLAFLVQQQSAVARHAHQHVAGTLFLQGAGRCRDFFIRVQLPAHDLAQLVVVGLDEEGVVGQHVHQQGAGGVHHTAHAPAVQPGQQPLVHVLRQAGGDAAG